MSEVTKFAEVTPLQVMLTAMRVSWKRAVRAGYKGPHMITAVMLAEKAAPYVHPKFATLRHEGNGGGPVQITVRKFEYDDEPSSPPSE